MIVDKSDVIAASFTLTSRGTRWFGYAVVPMLSNCSINGGHYVQTWRAENVYGVV
jgi:hypothetical protein